MLKRYVYLNLHIQPSSMAQADIDDLNAAASLELFGALYWHGQQQLDAPFNL